ncbi:MAG TPA: hypothetical protein VMS93_05100 [Candidatus Saccharimonadales bacterium]|nr:hypothetical protein [Candidatus Saccharimonadales bacterium]
MRPIHLSWCLPALAAVALLGPVGCSRQNNVAPRSRPARVVPTIQWVKPTAGAQGVRVDSMTAEALGPDGTRIAGPVALAINLDTQTFQGAIDVPSGPDRRIAVSGYATGDLVYHGMSEGISVTPGDTVPATVALRPMAVALVPSNAEPVFGDPVDVAVVDTAGAGYADLNVFLLQAGTVLDLASVSRGPDLPADARMDTIVVLKPGTSPVPLGLHFHQGTQPLPAGAARLAVLHFSTCPQGGCADGDTTALYIPDANALGMHETRLPLTTYGTRLTGRTRPVPADSGCVTGIVRRDGRPVAGATVTVNTGAQTTTDSQGSYCLPTRSHTGVQVTATLVVVGGPTYTGNATVTVGSAARCGGACASADVALAPVQVPPDSACVSGTVTLGGTGVGGAVVDATPGGAAVTDSAGRYCLAAPANTLISLSAEYSPGAGRLGSHATGSVHTGAVARCGGACATANLGLVQDTVPTTRYSTLAFIVRDVGLDSGLVSCYLSDDSLQQALPNAVVTITPDGGTPVQLANPDQTNFFFYASGSHIQGFPYVPVEFGRGYTLQIDRDGDGKVDATAHTFMPGLLTITNPTAGSVQPSSFDMTWSTSNQSDSVLYYAWLTPDTAAYQIGYNVSSAHFSGVATGDHTAHLFGWYGPALSSQLIGWLPNLQGGGVTGYFWGLVVAADVDFSVGAARPALLAARAGLPAPRMTPQALARATARQMRKILAHPPRR